MHPIWHVHCIAVHLLQLVQTQHCRKACDLCKAFFTEAGMLDWCVPLFEEEGSLLLCMLQRNS
jgi:hypothetical protein